MQSSFSRSNSELQGPSRCEAARKRVRKSEYFGRRETEENHSCTQTRHHRSPSLGAMPRRSSRGKASTAQSSNLGNLGTKKRALLALEKWYTFEYGDYNVRAHRINCAFRHMKLRRKMPHVNDCVDFADCSDVFLCRPSPTVLCRLFSCRNFRAGFSRAVLVPAVIVLPVLVSGHTHARTHDTIIHVGHLPS